MASVKVTTGFNKLENKKETPSILPDVSRTIEEPTIEPTIVPEAPVQQIPGFNNLNDTIIKGSEATDELRGQGSDTLTPELVQNEQDKQVMDNLDFLKSLKQSSSEQPKIGQAQSEEDGLGIRILSDITTGIGELGTQIHRGAQEAGIQGMVALDELSTWLNENIGFNEGVYQFYKHTGIGDLIGMDTSADTASKSKAHTPEEVIAATLQTSFVNPELRDQEAKSFTGGAAKSISQFLVGFIPVMKGLKVATGGTAIAKSAPWLVGVANSIFASSSAAVTFDPAEDRLSNLLKDLEATPEVAAPIFDYLATDPNDSRAEGRFKTALESMGLTAIGEGLFKALTAIKHVRNLTGSTKGLTPSSDIPEGAIPSLKDVTTTKTVPEGVQPNSKEFWFIEAKKNEEVISTLTNKVDKTPEEGQALQDAQEFVPVYVDKINKAKASAEIAESKATVTSKEQTHSASGKKETHADIEARVGPIAQDTTRASGFMTKEGKFITPEEAKALAQAELVAGPKLKFSGRPGKAFGDEAVEQAYLNGKGSLAKVVDSLDTGVLANTSHINEAINRLTKLSQFKFKKGDTTDLKSLEKLARRLGDDVQNLAIKQPDLTANPSKTQAYHYMLDASDNNLRQAAKEIVENADVAQSESALAEFIRRINIRQAINEQLRAGQMSKDINVIFDQAKPLAGDVPAQINQARALLQKFGGANKVRSMAEAVNNSKDINAIAKAVHPNSMKAIGDAFTSYWYWALLSGTGTHALNALSTGVNLMWQVPARAFAAQINKLLKSPNGVAVGEASQMMYGFVSSFKDALKSSWRVYKTGDAIIDKFEHSIPKDAISSARLGGGPVFGPIFDLSGKMFNYTAHNLLLGTDEFFRVMATNMQMRTLALRQAVGEGLEGRALAKRIETIMQDPSALQKLDVTEFANEVLFTTELGNKGKYLQSLLNAIPGSKLIIPFVRTPTNLVKQAIKTSPLGLLSKKMWKDISAGNARGQVQLAKTLMGTALVTATVEETMNSRITGYGPRDPQLREVWLLTHKPFSVWLGEEKGWITYNRLDPFGMVIATSASIAEAFGDLEPETYGELVGMLSTAIAQSIVNKTWASGPAGFIEALTEPQGFKAEQWLKRQMGSLLVPNIAAQAARLHDDMWRETYSGPDDPIFQEIWNQMKSRIPGLSEGLPAKRNIWGQPIWTMSLGPDVVSPFYQSIPDGKPINEWLWENRVEINMPSQVQLNSYTGGKGIQLSPHQYEKFVLLSGNAVKDPVTGMGLYDSLNAIMAGKHQYSLAWQTSTDGPSGTRAVLVKELISYYRQLAQDRLLSEDKELQHKVNKMRNKIQFNLTVGPGEPGGQ